MKLKFDGQDPMFYVFACQLVEKAEKETGISLVDDDGLLNDQGTLVVLFGAISCATHALKALNDFMEKNK